MVEGRKVGLGGLVVAGLGALVSGCGNTTPAFNDFVAGSVVNAGINRVVDPRTTNVNVGGGGNSSVGVGSTAYTGPPIDARELHVWVYEDKNGNGACDFESEVLKGVNEDNPVDLSRFGLATYLSDQLGNVKYSTWDLNGNLIGRGDGDRFFYTGTDVFSGDFMDALNGSLDGVYTITAIDEGRTFSKNVDIYHSVSMDSTDE